MFLLAAAAEMSREQILDLVKQTVLKALADKPAAVYLFGSFARGEEKPTSDIDVAIRFESPLSPETLPNLHAALNAAGIPREVEIVEITEGDVALICRVQREGIVWQE